MKSLRGYGFFVLLIAVILLVVLTNNFFSGINQESYSYTQFKNDMAQNIKLTYTIYGGYYAFYKNRHYGDEIIIDRIGELLTLLK